MKTLKIPAIALLAIALLLITAGCTQPAGTPPVTPTPVTTAGTEIDVLYLGVWHDADPHGLKTD